MRRPFRSAITTTVLLSIAAGSTSCATGKLWGWSMDQLDEFDTGTSYDYAPPSTSSSTSYQTSYGVGSYNNPGPSYSSSSSPAEGIAWILILGTPVTLAFDAVTLPIQIYKGLGPFEREEEAGS